MKVHPLIVSAALMALLSLQAWTLTRVADLTTSVAVLTSRIDTLAANQKHASNDASKGTYE